MTDEAFDDLDEVKDYNTNEVEADVSFDRNIMENRLQLVHN